MLPPGLTAQPAEPAEQAGLRALHPAARTVVRLLVGHCSCDLVRVRHAQPREDERHHRERHRRAGSARSDVIAALERHRQGNRSPGGAWPPALAGFVAEHARNAGPSLYLLRFVAGRRHALPDPAALDQRELRAAEVRQRPETWLAEDTAVLVRP